MSGNGFLQWIDAHCVTIRSVLIWAQTAFAFMGLIASFADGYALATLAWAAAFLCKWFECWLLERVLVAVQLELEAHP